MNREELERRLDEEGVDPSAYDLSGGQPSETYCLGERPDDWIVYYSERGTASGERLFANEKEACAHLLQLLLADPLTRSP
jgi:hypothetical protein